ncbi:AZOBR_p60025 family cell surface glycopolymer formation protein [Leptospira idonii]|uniref:DUF2029 domain-containing protein n=1 Tax=Leptospira idonii TaxID=1193500 RepID=A0A4R9M1B4_9LEPT|nr:hypothetical protein [Leptospira idonii]TGN19615.1 hypothetical protein EHS15_07455 [Leptospira idonii]
MQKLYSQVEFGFKFLDKNLKVLMIVFAVIWGVTTLSYWKKYEWNPTSMVNFGKEFALQNQGETPSSAILFKGEEGDLGAGYDGQIFYYFSRSLSNLTLNWPKGFDESYRAPRIGYPFLISLFGFFGKYFSILGMYFWNLFLILLSFFALRNLLSEDSKHLSVLYLLSPFALGSYYVLVSDSVMVSLVILAYYCLKKEKNLFFVLLSSLAILTKEPALFFLFPLGLKAVWEKDIKKAALIAATLVIPVAWHLYLSYRFPNWRAARLTEFILPFEGMIRYFESIFTSFSAQISWKESARLLSRFPLVVLFMLGSFLPFTGKIKKGWEFRISFLLVMFMIGTAGFYHFWSVYENVSRMFTLSLPALILLADEDRSLIKKEYILLTIALLGLFLIKALFITKPMLYQIGLG